MILALQTADAESKLWLIESTVGRADLSQPPAPSSVRQSGRELSNELLPQILETLKVSSAHWSDLTGVIIFSGPGSFTSLRIGHSVANALADSLNIPVVGARSDNWLEQGQQRLQQAKVGHPAVPHYGAEAHITRPAS